MSYQALYRTWRPRQFKDVIGQEVITQTLKNALTADKVSHAYLFSGPRGTGKTSCAKILAKAVNCTNLIDGEPCNHCENCIASDNGSLNDLLEIDAASNNGVDEIRDIRDKVKYAPSQGQYKVYIIDEVHMLSMGAFNALLKTLEEPPEHVIFILATTELQKVPATIISRTQKFIFKNLQVKTITNHLIEVLEDMEIDYDSEAVAMIAKVSDGGMRDALSILDQIISFNSGSQVTVKEVEETTGYANTRAVQSILISILNRNLTESLQESTDLQDKGITVKNILTEVIDVLTTMLLAQKDIKQANTTELIQKAQETSQNQLLAMIEYANEALNNLKYSTQQKTLLDVFVVKSVNYVPATGVEDAHIQEELTTLNQKLNQAIQQIEQLKSKPVQQVSTQSTKLPKPSVEKKRRHNYQQQVYDVLRTATKGDLKQVIDVWKDVLKALAPSKRAMMEVSKPVAASPTQVVIAFEYDIWFEKVLDDQGLLDDLNRYLELELKESRQIILVPTAEWPVLRQDFIKKHKSEIKSSNSQQDDKIQEEKSESDVVSKAKELFGSEFISIKD
ncbi:DNA polymerase III subunit gamma/tau [Holzapfeliella floricola]|uniref:DNA-directed DNA polymerase n=1 Tax=Holzapfeliella floricola DSM 23037 = JCM 16512 TaxID=1423744 RepID=A0A0R2DVQ2_9LACO|nr:DNA polymerase III subunit gamma/tau [Holzapfeliella floricola]KRN04228.1 DNA polymerase III [Holzapfeliella floricola DSM 23037 = JCM 16512]